MPQMMPINWMISLLFFISIFISFMIMNYFIFNYKTNFNLKKINKNNFKKNFWKW
uniref:ATP synthase complex subunit 8 n=2 Tax=Heliconius TaxID=33416 RepID=A0A0U1V569_HELCY|nr:ATP synthase F0 subunit 8 [Heliconius pachinus]YP_009058607.1 ATP synthase F0 subunit 8 [Heliconius cydno]AIJ02037.1 ATP synthase F0 subunit 8 [Heliconius pachinus]AIM46784.1 ATP synthase F0 subunit 8 [Heliconius cydno]